MEIPPCSLVRILFDGLRKELKRFLNFFCLSFLNNSLKWIILCAICFTDIYRHYCVFLESSLDDHLKSSGLDQCFLNFNVHKNCLQIVLKCRFWFSWSGWGLKFCISSPGYPYGLLSPKIPHQGGEAFPDHTTNSTHSCHPIFYLPYPTLVYNHCLFIFSGSFK